MMKKFICLFLLISSMVFGDLYRIDLTGNHLLSPTSTTGISTPNSLLMAPNIYGFNGPNYDCNAEGLYRYYIVATNYAQRLVYNGNVPLFMHSLTWIHGHGYLDDAASYSTALGYAKTRRIQMSCGYWVKFAQQLCAQVGITSRVISTLTLDTWNSYNNGHTMLEVYSGGKWKLWDIDLCHYFQQGGVDLNAYDFVQAVNIDDYDFVKFSDSPTIVIGNQVLSGYDYEFWVESAFVFDPDFKTFYDRAGQVVMILENGYYYFTCDPADRTRIESYSNQYVYMTNAAFLAHFYP